MNAAVALLLEARRQARPIDELPATCRPATLAEGYDLQDELVETLGDPVIGWKVACTSAAAQAAVGTDEPIAGRLRASRVVGTGADIELGRFIHPPALEVEFGFRLTGDIDGPVDRLELAEMVELVAAIELVDCRFADWLTVGAPSLVADNSAAGFVALGEPTAVPAHLVRALDTADAALVVDGAVVASGLGVAALGHPLASLAWLAGFLGGRGRSLVAGSIVITGSCTGMWRVDAPAAVRAVAAGLVVEVGLVPGAGQRR